MTIESILKELYRTIKDSEYFEEDSILEEAKQSLESYAKEYAVSELIKELEGITESAMDGSPSMAINEVKTRIKELKSIKGESR